jgi:hypothetical protein
MARGYGPHGEPYLYLGDIGDNLEIRSGIEVYRIAEPRVDPSKTGVRAAVAGVVRYRLRYEDHAHNAETLLVQPRTDRLFILTKSERGSGLYTSTEPLREDRVNVLHRVAPLDFSKLPAPPGEGRPGHGALLATGGDISPDGGRLAVCTYDTAWEWTVERGDVPGALSRPPRALPVHWQKQREGLCYTRDGKSILTSSEGKFSGIWELRP